MQIKEQYEALEVEVLSFEEVDVITTSQEAVVTPIV